MEMQWKQTSVERPKEDEHVLVPSRSGMSVTTAIYHTNGWFEDLVSGLTVYPPFWMSMPKLPDTSLGNITLLPKNLNLPPPIKGDGPLPGSYVVRLCRAEGLTPKVIQEFEGKEVGGIKKGRKGTLHNPVVKDGYVEATMVIEEI